MRHHNNDGSPQAVAQTNQSRHDYISLIEQAEQLVVDMKGRLPDTGLKHGVLHQLPSKTCNGAECTFIIVFLDLATFGDLSTGVFVTVDSSGRRRTSMIGGAK